MFYWFLWAKCFHWCAAGNLIVHVMYKEILEHAIMMHRRISPLLANSALTHCGYIQPKRVATRLPGFRPRSLNDVFGRALKVYLAGPWVR
ncbi:uncharacterized protein EV420DRAFT_482577 [Desarmillaria tabescens]|uniref:Secreted protein n=1 Tax=Armillaria tabescens TaxID=1929756 RepID=A0AA39N565_ARMTA|nr:uncharacterized protein EV420DRAFT_482577 [Desarmillaria tabescens]KAK0457848.1 hypothetical protein EV420DRAFT_482577 [Desarmillaria tabescens]